MVHALPNKHYLGHFSAHVATGLIQPELLPDGQVCVDMGEPILEADRIPTTLSPTQVQTTFFW